MIRNYVNFKVTGTEILDHGSSISWTETGICTEDQDPVLLAMRRNPDMVRCNRISVSILSGFSIETQNTKDRKRKITRHMGREEYDGYKDLRNRWDDPESIMIQRINKWEMKRDAYAAEL